MFYMHVHVQAMIHDPARNSVFYSVQNCFSNGSFRPAFVLFVFGDYIWICGEYKCRCKL